MTSRGNHATAAAVLRRVMTSLLVACVMPAVLFYVCFRIGGVGLAMGSALAWAYGAMLVRAVTGRRVSGMLVITTTVLTVRTVAAVLASSDFLYFVQPAVSDAILGVAFAVSVVVGQPLTARLADDFYPLTCAEAGRPALRTLFLRLAAGWSAYLVAKAVLIVWLLTHLATADFVRIMSMVNPALNISAAAITILTAFVVLRREGLLGHRPIALSAARPVLELEAAPAPVGA